MSKREKSIRNLCRMRICMVKGEEVVEEQRAQEAEDVSVVRPDGRVMCLREMRERWGNAFADNSPT